MNEMRKLMEALKRVDEFFGRDRTDFEKEVEDVLDKYDVVEVLMSEDDHNLWDDMIDMFDQALHDQRWESAEAYLSNLKDILSRYQDVDEAILPGKNQSRPSIDLSGPEGNAFVLLGHAKSYAKQLDLDADAIQKEMMQSDYENLISVFDKYFGDYVDLYRG